MHFTNPKIILNIRPSIIHPSGVTLNTSLILSEYNEAFSFNISYKQLDILCSFGRATVTLSLSSTKKIRQTKQFHHLDTERVCHFLLTITVVIVALKPRHHAWNGLE